MEDKPIKKVLVLFGSESDIPYILPEIQTSFEYTNIKYFMRIASEQRVPWMIREYINENVYDGIIPCGGLSYILSGHINTVLEELRADEQFRVHSRDFGIDKMVDSNYYDSEKQIPVLGVPIKDRKTIGETPFQCMIQQPTYHIGACVGVQKAEQAANLMTKILNNKWDNVNFFMKDVKEIDYREDNFYGKLMLILDEEKFRIQDDYKISFGEGNLKEISDSSLAIAVYDKGDIDWLKKIDSLGKPFIAVMKDADYKVDFRKMVTEVSQLDNAIHTRVGSAENAALLAAQYLSLSSRPPIIDEKKNYKNEIITKKYDQKALLDKIRELRKEKSQQYMTPYLKNPKLNPVKTTKKELESLDKH